MKNFLLLLALIGLQTSLFAQDYSNKGKDFWLTYPAHVDVQGSVMGIYITSDVNTTGQINAAGTIINFSVNANQVTKKFLGNSGGMDGSNTQVYLNMSDGIKAGAAIHITSERPVVVYAHIIRSARSGATLVLPTSVLGTDYLVPSYQSMGESGGSEEPGIGELAVVATQPNTVIEITPSVKGRNGKPAGVPFQVTLANAGDCYQFQTQRDADISGTLVKSVSSGMGCKPIAVFSATTWSAFDCGGSSGGDNLFQQLFPTKSWGKKFITAPFINRPYNIYRVYVTDPSTVVSVKENNITTVLDLTDYSPTKKCYELKKVFPLSIQADKPISVVQYISSQTCKTGCGTGGGSSAECYSDPEMVILNPVEQTLNSVTFFSAHQNYVPPGQTNVTQHYVNVIIPKAHKSSVKINGTTPNGSFVDITGTEYSYLQQNLTAVSAANPVHRIVADTGFSAIVYGYGNVESYGYNGGTNIKDQYQFLSVQNPYANVDFPATCKNTDLKLALTLPYVPTKLHWFFNNATGMVPNNDVFNNSPVADSTFVKDGRTLYVFKLPSTYKFNAVGTYPISINAFNPTPDGCSGEQELSLNIEVFDRPSAKFKTDHSGCLTEPVQFTDLSEGVGRSINGWRWSFGDGMGAFDKNPTYTYSNAGTFITKLRSINDIGCYADTSSSITLFPQAVADFKVSSPTCATRPVTFTDQSTVPAGGTIKKWYWDFGDGTLDTSLNNSNRTHSYSLEGNYVAKLHVENNVGCKTTVDSMTINVGALPEAGFILPEVCLADANARFYDTSKISDNTASMFKYAWNFGDGNATPANPNTSTDKNPIHKYSAVGNYEVLLTVTSNKNCTTSIKKPFTVNGSIPTANFTVTNASSLCSNNEIEIKNASTVDFGGLTKVQIIWDASNIADIEVDEEPMPGKAYRHSYAAFNSPATKTYSIIFRAYSGETCVDEIIRQVVLHAAPVVAFDPPAAACSNISAYQLTGGKLIGASLPGVGSYSGKGINSSGFFNPAMAGAGFHDIIYKYTTSAGCTDTATTTIQVLKAPTVDAGKSIFVLDDDSARLTPQVNAVNPIFKWSPTSFLSSDTSKMPFVRFPWYNVLYTLKVTGEEGCTAQDTVGMKVLYKLKIPNAFSPNGDGINDEWVIENLKDYPGCKIEIYTRSGVLIYNTIGYSRPWNGTINNKMAPNGVYYYIIDAKNGRKPVAGFVTIIR